MGRFNYFNYFTEIEEYFWKKRGAHLLVSPLDWAIVETWQKAGIPLATVLKGIDRAFESYARSKRGTSGRPLKSLAYCVDAVLDAAAEAQEAAAGSAPEVDRPKTTREPFSREELWQHFAGCAKRLNDAAAKNSSGAPRLAKGLADAARSLEDLALLVTSHSNLDLEDLERRLTVLEEKIMATLTCGAAPETLLEIRRETDRALAPYRGKMTGEQIAQLHRHYMQKRLYEICDLPRLSLFYLK